MTIHASAKAIQPPTIADVQSAAERISGVAIRTPLLFSPVLSERTGGSIFLKPECLQRTGSFKFRGAWNAVQALGERARDGVVACSSGNHGQGLAEAARLAGIKAVVVMPADAPVLKRQRTARSGARVVLYDREREDRDGIARAIAAEEGLVFVHPYNDPDVIAGQGTAALEIAADCVAMGVAPDSVVVPCSGGGLGAGTALAINDRFPTAAVFVAEPRDFDDYSRSLKSGSPEVNRLRGGSLCDALLAESPGSIGWAINRTGLAGGVTASDEEALHAVGLAYDELRLVVEPGGAVGLAALLAGRLEADGRTVVIMLSGGNVSDEVLAEAIRVYRSGEVSETSSV